MRESREEGPWGHQVFPGGSAWTLPEEDSWLGMGRGASTRRQNYEGRSCLLGRYEETLGGGVSVEGQEN